MALLSTPNIKTSHILSFSKNVVDQTQMSSSTKFGPPWKGRKSSVSFFPGVFCWCWHNFGGDWALGYNSMKFWDYSDLSWFPKIQSLLSVRQFVIQLVYLIFITNNHALFHFGRNENLVKHQKFSKYYDHVVRKKPTKFKLIFPVKNL